MKRFSGLALVTHAFVRTWRALVFFVCVAALFISGGCGSKSTSTTGGPPLSSSKLGPHVLDVPNNAGAETILAACPRVAKWVAPYGGFVASALSDYKTRCPMGTVILRVYISPSLATYTVADDPVASANDFWNKMLAQGLTPEGISPKQIDWLEGPNELDNLPNWYNDPPTAQWVASFWSALADLMHSAGYNPLVGSVVGGQPSPVTIFAPLATAMKSKGYKWGWSHHSYTFTASMSVSTEAAYALYYRQIRDQNGLAGIPIVLSEGGYLTPSSAGWQGQLTGDQYLSWLQWFDAQIKQDPDVVGLTIFQVGNTTEFQSFDLTPIAPALATYLVNVS